MAGKDHERPPEEVQRQLRREAGFGCCRCGHPFYEYHHIIPWEVEKHFRPEDMMIVCPNCHHEITTGKVSIEEQRRWKSHPSNIKAGKAFGLLRVEQRELAVALGGGMFIETPVLLRISGEDMVTMKRSIDGRLLVSITSYDENDELVFKIEDNEWITGSKLPWDLYAKWRHVTLRQKMRGIGLEVDAREEPVKVRGTFWKYGHWYKATESSFLDENRNIYVVSASYCHAGIIFSATRRFSFTMNPAEGALVMPWSPEMSIGCIAALRRAAEGQKAVVPDVLCERLSEMVRRAPPRDLREVLAAFDGSGVIRWTAESAINESRLGEDFLRNWNGQS